MCICIAVFGLNQHIYYVWEEGEVKAVLPYLFWWIVYFMNVNEWVQFQSLLHKKKGGSVHGNQNYEAKSYWTNSASAAMWGELCIKCKKNKTRTDGKMSSGALYYIGKTESTHVLITRGNCFCQYFLKLCCNIQWRRINNSSLFRYNFVQTNTTNTTTTGIIFAISICSEHYLHDSLWCYKWTF